MNLITLGGALNMNSRYYIKGNKVFYRYNNLFRHKQRAIRKNEVEAAIRMRQNIMMAFVAILFVSIFSVGYFLTSSFVFNDMNYVYAYSHIEQPINVDTVIEENGMIQSALSIYDSEIEINRSIEENIIEEDVMTDVLENTELIEVDLPSEYYGDKYDFSYFQPTEDYRLITNKRSPAYQVTQSENCYTDENGLRRYKVSDDQFSIDGEDDYVVAMGTFYKPKGTAGNRFLIETTTGSFTVITGDEKSDSHTDSMNMFTVHGGGEYVCILEWIVDTDKISPDIIDSGTVTEGPVDEAIKGEILHIYEIQDNSEV